MLSAQSCTFSVHVHLPPAKRRFPHRLRHDSGHLHQLIREREQTLGGNQLLPQQSTLLPTSRRGITLRLLFTLWEVCARACVRATLFVVTAGSRLK